MCMFVFFVLILTAGIAMGIHGKKKGSYYASLFIMSIAYFIAYFQNRLLYSMCVGLKN